MRKNYLEMGFSVEGFHPKGHTIHTNREGFLFRKSNATGEYKPISPKVLPSGHVYFQFMIDGKIRTVKHNDIQEEGLDAKFY